MRRRRKGALFGGAAALAALLACAPLMAGTAAAQTAAPGVPGKAAAPESMVRIETVRLGALDMKARHVRPPDAELETLLIVHDTLGAYSDPLIAALQSALAERGLASLAINLTLGVSGREAPLGCNVRQTHRHRDALEEIDAWTDWLLGQGLGPVVLVGHGRGGAQAAWHLASRAGARVAGGILLAPTGWTPKEADAEYRARYAAGISALLTRIAGLAPDAIVENVPFLHCGAVDATKAAIESYYGAQPMRDAPTALATDKRPVLVLLPEAGAAGEEAETARRLEALANPAVVVRRVPGADAQFAGAAFPAMVEALAAFARSAALNP